MKAYASHSPGASSLTGKKTRTVLPHAGHVGKRPKSAARAAGRFTTRIISKHGGTKAANAHHRTLRVAVLLVQAVFPRMPYSSSVHVKVGISTALHSQEVKMVTGQVHAFRFLQSHSSHLPALPKTVLFVEEMTTAKQPPQASRMR